MIKWGWVRVREGKIRIALDEMLEEMNLTRYALSKQTGIQYQTIDKYYKNKVYKYDSELLYKICSVLNCEVGDILRITYCDLNKKAPGCMNHTT